MAAESTKAMEGVSVAETVEGNGGRHDEGHDGGHNWCSQCSYCSQPHRLDIHSPVSFVGQETREKPRNRRKC